MIKSGSQATPQASTRGRAQRGGLLGTSLVVFLSLLLPGIAKADEITQNLESVVIESFDPGPQRHDWYVQGSQYVAAGYPKWTYAKAWPEALFGRNPTNQNLEVLGVNAAFDRQGYNHLDIFPVTKNSKGQLVSDPIPIPGRVQTLDVWVWGSDHAFTMDVEVEDYNGMMYMLRLGSLDFAGWRDLAVNIPNYIPQSVRTIPKLRGLKLVKFVIWTDPTANVSNFYVYLDQVKVLTDTFQQRIDGAGLADPSTVQQIWSAPGVQKGQ